jgi:hypothetical protein
LGKDNSTEVFGETLLYTPLLSFFLKQYYHNYLISTPNHLLLKREKELKMESVKFPVNIFKPKQEVKKINFPNIGKKSKKKKEGIFVHNFEKSNAELYFLVNKKFKKSQIMESLFEKPRKSSGFELKFSEDVESISHVRSEGQFNFNERKGQTLGITQRLRVYFKDFFEGRFQMREEANSMDSKLGMDWVIDLDALQMETLSKEQVQAIWTSIDQSDIIEYKSFSPAKSTSCKSTIFMLG